MQLRVHRPYLLIALCSFVSKSILLLNRCGFYVLQSEQQLDCALDLMRRLPPQQIEKNLSDLIDLVTLFCTTYFCICQQWYLSEYLRLQCIV